MASRRGGTPVRAPATIVEDHPPPPPSPSASSKKTSEIAPVDVAGDIDPPPDGDEDEMKPLSVEKRYRSERMAAKARLWKEGEYAAGLVELTWRDELTKRQYGNVEGDDNDDNDANGAHKPCCSDACSEVLCCFCCCYMESTCCCLQLSGMVCSRLGAGRVGNMAILRETPFEEEVEVEDDPSGDGSDDGNGGSGAGGDVEKGLPRTRMVQRTRIDLVVGPYWPMLFFVTWPLVLGVSFWTAISAVPGKPLLFQLAWAVLTGGLIYALFGVSCRDPGILRRRSRPENGEWRWNDQAQTYRPRGAIYDADCAVIIEEFDHTCPWTGTGIGKKNMPAFQAFMGLVFVCLIMDILTLTGAFG